MRVCIYIVHIYPYRFTNVTHVTMIHGLGLGVGKSPEWGYPIGRELLTVTISRSYKPVR